MRFLLAHCRRLLRLVWVLGLVLVAPLVAAQEHGGFVDGPALDALFVELRSAPDEATAREIDRRIWLLWVTPSDPELASRMQQVFEARTIGDPLTAITLLNEIVADYPDYAEGWNQRATMLYMVGNLNASIADCARVLELEPRHFGALSGRAVIYLQRGERALARRDMAAALAIHPFLSERQLFPELVQDITRI